MARRPREARGVAGRGRPARGDRLAHRGQPRAARARRPVDVGLRAADGAAGPPRPARRRWWGRWPRSRSRSSGPGSRRRWRCRSGSSPRATSRRRPCTTACARRSTSSAASTPWSTRCSSSRRSASGPSLACWRWSRTRRRPWRSSTRRRSRGSSPVPWTRSARRGPRGSRCCGSGSCPRCSRCSSPTSSTASSRTSGPRRCWASSAPEGIGLYLQTYLRMIDYPAASTVLLVTVVMVMVVDFASARIRARLV